jgi:nitroreductase
MTTTPIDAIRRRRSTKSFTSKPVPREEIELLLDLATCAPNHRMTEPWNFIVLGPQAKRRFGEIKGGRRAAKMEDPDSARAVLEKTVSGMEAIPANVGFVQKVSPEPEVREEDYAAVYMGIQNFLIGALASGFGTHVRTGAIMEAPEVRDALGVGEGERIVALVELGEEAAVPPEKARASASARTRWLP